MSAVVGAMLLLTGCSGYATSAFADTGVESNADDVAYLAGYGEWITVEPYGQVWQPWVSSGWEPFYYGHWGWSDPDWAWVSYEPYGWLVYHYGNWGYDPGTGWFWVPGDTWSPAQVEWYTAGDYCGWAPIPPRGMTWGDPWESDRFDAWTVVRLRDFDHENIGRYRVRSLPRSIIVTRSHDYYHQPEISVVQRSLKRPVRSVTIETRPVQMGPKAYRRMDLHPEQQKIVARHQGKIVRRVLVSQAEFHKRVDRERAHNVQAGNARHGGGHAAPREFHQGSSERGPRGNHRR